MTLEVTTACGHWGWHEHRYFGYAVFEELAPRESLTGLVALSITGRRWSAEQCAILDATAACLTLADARIWPLKMTRLVASYGRSVAATAAGLLVEEDARIGPWTTVKCAELLRKFSERLGEDVEPSRLRQEVSAYLAEHHFVWGFGTPFRERDERLVAYRERLGPSRAVEQRYFRLADAIAEEVFAARGTAPNMGLAVGAVLLDLGVALHQIGPLATALMQHMFFAHAVEAARESPSVTRCLPGEYVRYVGPGPRESPRARADHRNTL
jgi:hypothetical protein